MGRANDERFYRAGMSHIMEIVEVAGIEAGRLELKSRGILSNEPIPGLTSYKRTTLGRECAEKELNIVATALAMTVGVDMGFPPSTIAELLDRFNTRCSEYRVDAALMDQAGETLSANPYLAASVKKYMDNAKID